MMMMMMMMMMIMTDPFTTNLVVKGSVAKGSVVKGAHPMMIIMIMLLIKLMASFLQMMVQVEKEEEASNSVAANTREGALDELGKEDSSTIHQMSSKYHDHDHDHEDDMRKESMPRRQHLITATVRQMAKKDQLLLIPVTLW